MRFGAVFGSKQLKAITVRGTANLSGDIKKSFAYGENG
jgi:aldehyde:ferredoxin oxidoreductase